MCLAWLDFTFYSIIMQYNPVQYWNFKTLKNYTSLLHLPISLCCSFSAKLHHPHHPEKLQLYKGNYLIPGCRHIFMFLPLFANRSSKWERIENTHSSVRTVHTLLNSVPCVKEFAKHDLFKLYSNLFGHFSPNNKSLKQRTCASTKRNIH